MTKGKLSTRKQFVQRFKGGRIVTDFRNGRVSERVYHGKNLVLIRSA
jgi:hypothetical protein